MARRAWREDDHDPRPLLVFWRIARCAVLLLGWLAQAAPVLGFGLVAAAAWCAGAEPNAVLCLGAFGTVVGIMLKDSVGRRCLPAG